MIEMILTIFSMLIFIGIVACLSKSDILQFNILLTQKKRKYETKVLMFSISITLLAIIAVLESFLLGVNTYNYLFNHVDFNAKLDIMYTLISVFCYSTFDVLLFLNTKLSKKNLLF